VDTGHQLSGLRLRKIIREFRLLTAILKPYANANAMTK
jgi:hypothetical protein